MQDRAYRMFVVYAVQLEYYGKRFSSAFFIESFIFVNQSNLKQN